MNAEHTKNWPDLAIGLYDRLTGNNAEIIYGFEDLHIRVPSGTGADATAVLGACEAPTRGPHDGIEEGQRLAGHCHE